MKPAFALTTAILVLASSMTPIVVAGPTAGVSGPGPAVDTAAKWGGTSIPSANETDGPLEGDHPEDPDEDVLGWEEVGGHGIWANETIAVNNDDGLNQTELDQLVARTMARIEVIRQLEFQGEIPVEIRSREAYRQNVTNSYANTSNADRVHQNVKFEATFMVGEDADAIDQLASNRAASVLGFYSPTEDKIVIISDNQDVLQMNEFTLSHELAHALQDQHFNISRYQRRTEDENNAISGIIEGDAHYVEKLYAERCNSVGNPWNGTCVRPSGSGSAGGGPNFHIGLYLVSFQPYSDGPGFVHQLRQEGGWEAVNQVYANPPASAEQVVHPEKYPDEKPENVTVEDLSNDDWEILALEGNDSINYATFGEGGLFSMFWYPSYRERGNAIIQYNHLFQVSPAGYDAFNYNHWITNGWDGDKLYPYVPTDVEGNYSSERTGYVWKIHWDTDEDAREFVRGYDDLLKYYGAVEVDGRDNTYLIPDGEPFADAFYVHREGSTVWIVNAPTVDELSAVRDGSAPTAQATTTTTTGTPSGDGTTATTTVVDDDTTTTTMADDGDSGTDGQELPGFGVAMAILAVIVGTVVALRRARR